MAAHVLGIVLDWQSMTLREVTPSVSSSLPQFSLCIVLHNLIQQVTMVKSIASFRKGASELLRYSDIGSIQAMPRGSKFSALPELVGSQASVESMMRKRAAIDRQGPY